MSVIEQDTIYQNIKHEIDKTNLQLMDRYKFLTSLNDNSKTIVSLYTSYFEKLIQEKIMQIKSIKHILEYLEHLKKESKKSNSKSKSKSTSTSTLAMKEINNDINKLKCELYTLTIDLVTLKNKITT
jgi:hypothetical protein